MARRIHTSAWARTLERSFAAMTRNALRAGAHAVGQALNPAAEKRKPPPGPGAWIAGVVIGTPGARRFRLYRPPDMKFGERLALMVMLHGCGQDAKSFAMSTRRTR